ncbi:MAG: hypothetical protein FLDDKLPJ_03318 [Phycisphaerae bacterium]|nr:hypothetical protein [Phycisphaerae bacterium]
MIVERRNRRQLNRPAPLVRVIIALVGSAGLALGQNEPEPEATYASQVREVMSLDPITLAALGVAPLDAYNLALGAMDDAVLRKELLDPLVNQCLAARAACGAIHVQEDYDVVRAGVEQAVAMLSANQGEWFQGDEQLFDQNDQTALENAQANIILESPLRLLALSPEQRSLLWEAQAERDFWTLNGSTRRRSALVAKAWDEHRASVEQILTTEQFAELAAYVEQVNTRLPGILASESDAFNDARHAAARGWRPFLARVGPRVREVVPALVDALRRALPSLWTLRAAVPATSAARPSAAARSVGGAAPPETNYVGTQNE